MLQAYLYNQYKSLGTQKVFCTIQPVHVTHTAYTLKHTTIVRSAPIMYLIEVMGLFLQNILWHWIVIDVGYNNYNNKQSHQNGIFRPVQAIFRVLCTRKEVSDCFLYLQHVTWRYCVCSGLCCLFSGCFPRLCFVYSFHTSL